MTRKSIPFPRAPRAGERSPLLLPLLSSPFPFPFPFSSSPFAPFSSPSHLLIQGFQFDVKDHGHHRLHQLPPPPPSRCATDLPPPRAAAVVEAIRWADEGCDKAYLRKQIHGQVPRATRTPVLVLVRVRILMSDLTSAARRRMPSMCHLPRLQACRYPRNIQTCPEATRSPARRLTHSPTGRARGRSGEQAAHRWHMPTTRCVPPSLGAAAICTRARHTRLPSGRQKKHTQ